MKKKTSRSKTAKTKGKKLTLSVDRVRDLNPNELAATSGACTHSMVSGSTSCAASIPITQ